MKFIEWFKKLLGISKKTIQIEQPKEKQKKDTLTVEEKIFSSGDEMAITAYFNHQAYKKGLTHSQLMATFENALKTKENKTRKINFEFVPKLQANRNVRTYLEFTTGSYSTWQTIRNNEEEKAGCKCVICGMSSKDYDQTKTTNTECHEVWKYEYNEKRNLVQKLVKLESLCFICHSIKHANQHYRDNEFFNTLMQIYAGLNNLPDIELAKRDYHKHLTFTFDKQYNTYQLDLSNLKNYGINGVNEYFDSHKNSKFNMFLNEYKHNNNQNKRELENE